MANDRKTVEDVAHSSLKQAVEAIQQAKAQGLDTKDPIAYANACALVSIAARLPLPTYWAKKVDKSIFEHVFG